MYLLAHIYQCFLVFSSFLIILIKLFLHRPNYASKLEKYLGSDKDEAIWFYFSIFGVFCKLPTKICQLATEEFQKCENWTNPSFMENILKVLQNSFKGLPYDDLEVIQGKIIPSPYFFFSLTCFSCIPILYILAAFGSVKSFMCYMIERLLKNIF